MKLGTIIGIIAAMVAMYYSDIIKQLLKEYFSRLTKMQLTALLCIIILVALVLPPTVGSIVSNDSDSENEESVNKSADEIKAELIEKGVTAGVKAIITLAEQKRIKDSIFDVNREKVWAYQIGSPKSIQASWKLFKEIKEVVPEICMFKENKTYRLVIMESNLSEEQLKSVLPTVIEKLSFTGEKISLVNLMASCARNQTIREHIIKNRKEKLESACFECRKVN